MNFFGIGLPELAVIAAIGLLVFGPKRLPELGKTLGRTLKGFQSASQEFEKEFRSAIATEPEPVATPVSPVLPEAAAALEASAPLPAAVSEAGTGEVVSATAIGEPATPTT
ncbi:TatA/E family twin arginine-targeting protein translocase [Synechococcus sp. CS-1328]|uniref:TatA/E family twin arginine-targeting protein translocase n=1 Tax=Synechococcus sp. CS-1328 TaxID=2847976 RepID=UPI00223C2F7A|nr:TatA/E family twin arginine-targeting protein translocase [Synechococcus sp. CS-1328]